MLDRDEPADEDPCQARLDGTFEEFSEIGWCPRCEAEFPAREHPVLCPSCMITRMVDRA